MSGGDYEEIEDPGVKPGAARGFDELPGRSAKSTAHEALAEPTAARKHEAGIPENRGRGGGLDSIRAEHVAQGASVLSPLSDSRSSGVHSSNSFAEPGAGAAGGSGDQHSSMESGSEEPGAMSAMEEYGSHKASFSKRGFLKAAALSSLKSVSGIAKSGGISKHALSSLQASHSQKSISQLQKVMSSKSGRFALSLASHMNKAKQSKAKAQMSKSAPKSPSAGSSVKK